jgi:hypothetical protein
VGVDQDAAEAFDAEALDEAHAAHVGRQVVDFHRAFADATAVLLVAHVQAEVFHAGMVLIPLGQRLLVHRANAGEPFLVKYRTSEPPMNPPAPVMTIVEYRDGTLRVVASPLVAATRTVAHT